MNRSYKYITGRIPLKNEPRVVGKLLLAISRDSVARMLLTLFTLH